MATHTVPMEPRAVREEATNGSAVAAFVGGSIGAFAMGVVVILNEAGIFAAPTLYGRPAACPAARCWLRLRGWSGGLCCIIAGTVARLRRTRGVLCDTQSF